jgi:hypothetical protein
VVSARSARGGEEEVNNKTVSEANAGSVAADIKRLREFTTWTYPGHHYGVEQHNQINRVCDALEAAQKDIAVLSENLAVSNAAAVELEARLEKCSEALRAIVAISQRDMNDAQLLRVTPEFLNQARKALGEEK